MSRSAVLLTGFCLSVGLAVLIGRWTAGPVDGGESRLERQRREAFEEGLRQQAEQESRPDRDMPPEIEARLKPLREEARVREARARQAHTFEAYAEVEDVMDKIRAIRSGEDRGTAPDPVLTLLLAKAEEIERERVATRAALLRYDALPSGPGREELVKGAKDAYDAVRARQRDIEARIEAVRAGRPDPGPSPSSPSGR